VVSDLKLVQRTYFDLKVENGNLVPVSGLEMKEQYVLLLVYSTWKPLIGYGVDIRSFRGSRLDLVKPVILDRVARSVAFINTFYPLEARLPEIKNVKVNFLSGILNILVEFMGMKVEITYGG
jgi:hypothetical protein